LSRMGDARKAICRTLALARAALKVAIAEKPGGALTVARRRLACRPKTPFFGSRPAMPSDPRYWFSAKRYGWGWGFPIAWQGWLVFAAFLGLLIAGGVLFSSLFPPRRSLAAFLTAYLIYIVVLDAALLAVCWLKGEPPRWRWGEDE
jgi:hypothetical protein